jgi:hypothetical protein
MVLVVRILAAGQRFGKIARSLECDHGSWPRVETTRPQCLGKLMMEGVGFEPIMPIRFRDNSTSSLSLRAAGIQRGVCHLDV